MHLVVRNFGIEIYFRCRHQKIEIISSAMIIVAFGGKHIHNILHFRNPRKAIVLFACSRISAAVFFPHAANPDEQKQNKPSAAASLRKRFLFLSISLSPFDMNFCSPNTLLGEQDRIKMLSRYSASR